MTRGPVPLSIWLVTDGKAGHLNQMRGLAYALGALAPAESHPIAAPGGLASLAAWLTGRFAPGTHLPAPDLILCAGRATHIAALAARRAHGGRVVVLMRPSLPLGWFDLCLVPRHDLEGSAARDRIVPTLGALCDVRPSHGHASAAGVFLIGGPSKRHGWDEPGVVAAVSEVVERTPGVRWRLTTSRRTPASTTSELQALRCERLEIVPVDMTPLGWVHDALASAGTAWVTEDSVSMLYEALTSGCAVGALPVPRLKTDRVTRGVDALAREGLVTTFDAWRDGGKVAPPTRVIDEAARCAAIILERWFPERSGEAPA